MFFYLFMELVRHEYLGTRWVQIIFWYYVPKITILQFMHFVSKLKIILK